jgi:uncharacterized protein (DUF488 family)
MPIFDLFSIGHSNIPAERFVEMLRAAGADAVADVRSTPVSRFCPWFSAKNFAPLLAQENIAYLPYGAVFGGRPRTSALYRDGIAGFEAMARQPEFAAGLERLSADARRHRVCLMCAERDPLDCHRCLLVAREFAARGCKIGHILFDGSIEPHEATERRLLALVEENDGGRSTEDLFPTGLGERLAAAYRRRSQAVAYRAKPVGEGAATRLSKEKR